MLKPWFLASVATLICFGCWGFFGKLTTEYLSTKQAFLYQGLGVCLILLLFQYMLPQTVSTHSFKGNVFGALTGVAYALGTGLFFYAAAKGKITLVIMMTALYPIVTIFLSLIFLSEAITFKHSLGIVLAVIAIMLMAS